MAVTFGLLALLEAKPEVEVDEFFLGGYQQGLKGGRAGARR